MLGVSARSLAASLAIAGAVVGLGAPRARAASANAGELIYRQGILPSGRTLHGDREGGVGVDGVGAACATCHRRSGLGSWEGQSVVPPIIGRYLFRPGARNVEDVNLPHVQGYVPRRDAYSDATLARAIRSGVDQQGRTLSYLMPRYKLDDAAMASLIAYLKSLTSGPFPGVGDDTLHFATIITPDADPVARKGMLEVLQQFFADKNAGYRGSSPPLQSTRGVMYRVNRKWQLHVWELAGPPDTWDRQLRKRLAATPVFAVMSGIGGKTWAPVHRFCEREAIPCLLPNVDLPVVAEDDFYPIYFSKGVLLEAELILRRLDETRDRSAVKRVVQLFREDDIGAPAATALRSDAAKRGLVTTERVLESGSAKLALAAALEGVGAGDALVLWLRPGEWSALPAAPPPGAVVYASGLMGGMENAPVPAAWRGVTRVTYPLNLPDLRKVQMDFPRGWFNVRHIPVVAERVQTDTYLACVIVAETVGHMLDSFVRDYLVERVEVMLSHRLVNAHYPRLGLAPGQRFASKGGYIVHFAQPAGTRLAADGDWTAP
ncbi:MAG: c-type cytochrome [Polyangia bacterium]